MRGRDVGIGSVAPDEIARRRERKSDAGGLNYRGASGDGGCRSDNCFRRSRICFGVGGMKSSGALGRMLEPFGERGIGRWSSDFCLFFIRLSSLASERLAERCNLDCHPKVKCH
jgi:hypothetical protein